MASLDPIQQIKDRIEAERHRVDQLLRRDRDDDESDRLRVQAILEIDDGKFVNLQDTVLGPTREQLAHSEYISFTPRGRDGTIRSVKGYRKQSHSTVLRMHRKGQITDEGFFACIWYARKYEQAGLEGSVGSIDYGREVFSAPMDHTAFSEWQEEARFYLRIVKGELPKAFIKFFENIVVHSLPVHRAKRSCRIRSDRALPKFKELSEIAYRVIDRIDPVRQARK